MKTVEFYNDDEFVGQIFIKDSVILGEVEDLVWKLCEKEGWIANEEDFD